MNVMVSPEATPSSEPRKRTNSILDEATHQRYRVEKGPARLVPDDDLPWLLSSGRGQKPETKECAGRLNHGLVKVRNKPEKMKDGVWSGEGR